MRSRSEVNQRFPVFYSEKRPFFMEGMGLFNIAGTGFDGNMRTAVHTRRIVDPNLGQQADRHGGQDHVRRAECAGRSSGRDVGDRRRLFTTTRASSSTIGRATYALRRSDYFGAIFTEHDFMTGRHNQVIGGDVRCGPRPRKQVSATFLSSPPRASRATTPTATRHAASYSYPDATVVQVSSQAEHYDRRLRDGHGVLQPHRLHDGVWSSAR